MLRIRSADSGGLAGIQWRIQGRGPGGPTPPPLFLDLPRECGRSRPPESGVAPLASVSNSLATPVRVTAKEW